MSSDFKHFLSPIKIGPMEVKNRAVISAHHTSLSEPRTKDYYGHASLGERYAAYIEARAKGGVGLIILGQWSAHPTTCSENMFGENPGWDDEAVPGMKLAVDACHRHGTKAICQFFHSGFMNKGDSHRGIPAWSASDLAPPPHGIIAAAAAKAMDKDDMDDLKKHYVLCARNAVKAGADGVEIHAAHSYLLNQFLSPIYNKRTDEYGGSLENRMRLMMEVLADIRQEIGRDKVLGIRLSTEEYTPGGLTIQDHQEVAKKLEEQGAIDYINVSQGLITHSVGVVVPMLVFPHAAFASNAAAIKEVVSDKVKVLATGRIIDPVEAEQILADGHADLCIMTRAHVADPEIVKKTMEGRTDELRACCGDGNGCCGGGPGVSGLQCTQNPVIGFEREIGEIVPAAKKKKVLVAGGGPGGMEAAWVAAARGHDVTLYEKGSELGGQVLLARELPGESELDAIIRWRKMMVEKYGVKVVLNTEVTADLVAAQKPDAVIIAIGGSPRRDGFGSFGFMPVYGYESPKVTIPEDILEGKYQAGQNVLVYDAEGFARGVGIAEKLAAEGKKVHLVTPEAFPAGSHNAMFFLPILPRLQGAGIEMTVSTMALSTADSDVHTYNIITSKMETISGLDTIVLVSKGLPNNALYDAIKGKVLEIHRVGDAFAVRRLDHAVTEGHRAGWAL